MGWGAAMFAMSAVSAISQIGQGRSQQAEANYNADLVEQEAENLDIQKNIDYGRYQRLKGQYMATSVANVAGSGIALQGSALAVMIETQRQITEDQAIGQYNIEQEQNYKLNQAGSIRREGKQAKRTGYTNAFSTILGGASRYAMYENPLRKA